MTSPARHIVNASLLLCSIALPLWVNAFESQSIDQLLTTEKAHQPNGVLNYLDISSRDLEIPSKILNGPVAGSTTLTPSTTNAESRIPLGDSGLAFSSYLGTGSFVANDSAYNNVHVLDNGSVVARGLGLEYKPSQKSPLSMKLSWDHYDFEIDQMLNLPANSDSTSITSFGISYDF